MSPSDLRFLCETLNDERGTGGQSKLARLLGWNHSTVRRKLNSKSRITPSDELAIMAVVEKRPEQGSNLRPAVPETAALSD